MTKYNCKQLKANIKNDVNSCFDHDHVFEFNDWLYEHFSDEDDVPAYRVIFSEDDYDYVEDEDKCDQLLIARLAQA